MDIDKKRLPEVQDIWELERLTGGDYCPEKDMVCYASTQTNGIILKDLKTGKSRKISAYDRGESYPRFSADGNTILFLSVTPDEGRQIFEYDIYTNKIRQITHFQGPIIDPVWAPDGNRILFASASSTHTSEKKRPDEPVVVEDFGYKFDGLGFVWPDSHMHLYVVDTRSGKTEKITSGSADYMHHNWAPDSRTVICLSNIKRSREDSLGYDLFTIDSISHEFRQISRDLWLVSYPNPLRPVCTPDGRYVITGVLAPGYRGGNDEGYPEVYLYKFPVEGGEPEKIFISDENCFQCVQFPYYASSGMGMDKLQISDDGRYVYFCSGWYGQANIYRLDLSGDGHAILLKGGKQIYHGMSGVHSGKMMVCRTDPVTPEEYIIINADTGETMCTAVHSAEDLLAKVNLSMPYDFMVPTNDGESVIHGFVLPPQEMAEGQKYPAVLYIHGGPHPFYSYGISMEHQYLASKGFVILCCNPRGSSAYGALHQDYSKAMDGTAYNDCLKFVEEAVKRYPWIDASRIGVTGGSYGGYMTNYMATHTDRFKAYITQRSSANMLYMYANSDMQGSSLAYDSYEQFMIDKIVESPVAYAEKINKPFLILHGELDFRTPADGAHQLFVAIKDTHPDLPVKLVIFPHIGHEQPEDPRQLSRYYEEMTEWFREYL